MVASKQKRNPMGSMISVRIPDALKEKVDEIAQAEGKYASDIIKELIAARVEMKDAGIAVKNTKTSVSIDRLLDELIQYRQRSTELQKMMENRTALFGDPPAYLAEAKRFCDRK